MGKSIFDERDMLFNIKECPGAEKILEMEKFQEFGVEDLQMIFDQALQFADNYLAPSNAECDKEGCQLVDGIVKTPEQMKALWRDYVEIGITGVSSNPEFGGIGMPHLFAAPLTELECGGNLSFSMITLLTREAANLIDSFGTQELKEIYLEKMFTGQWAGTMCLTEPQAGSDVGAATTRAVPAGNKIYKISGTKSFISWGDHELTENIVHLVLARIEGAPKGTKGLSLFLVPKYRVGNQGQIQGSNDICCSSVEHKMGIKASPTCVLNFGENEDCEGYLIGEEHCGLKHMFQMMNAARNGVGIQGLAIASVAAQHAQAYATERKQGTLAGQEKITEIVHHPDVKFMLWKTQALVQAMRSMLYHGAYFEDLTHHHDEKEKAKAKALFELLTPINKSYATDLGFKVTELSMQIYGGYGYCQDYPIEQLMRDIKITSIYEGTNGIQALDLMFRKVLGSQGTAAKVLMGEIQKAISKTKNTELAEMGKQLERGLDLFAKVVEKIVRFAGEKKFDALQFHATQFLNAMGHFTGGYFLLKSSLVALSRKTDKDPFYLKKIQTTQFFFNYVLPEAQTLFQIMLDQDGDLTSVSL